MRDWTTDQVLALAPDAASASAGQGLASEKKWSSLGRSDRAAWGLCQGSGKDPYQTRVDLAEGTCKCSCPSRKFPCKHGLGLLLVLAKNAGVFKQIAEPGWVAEWLDGRAARAEKAVAKTNTPPREAPADPAAQAKRAAQRDARVMDGVAGCRLWLDDLLRRGLAAAQTAADGELERVAARMVDAQAPGLAVWVRRTAELLASGEGWEVRTLDHLGRLHLLLKAAERLAQLPPDLTAEVRTALGYNQSKDDVLAGPGVSDRWLAVGQIIEDDDRLRTRRTWLLGRQTARWALLLDFAPGSAPLPAGIAPASELTAELAFYPGNLPCRALVKSAQPAGGAGLAPASSADPSIEQALVRYANALAANPWIARWPLFLDNLQLANAGNRWWLADAAGDTLPLAPAFQAGPPLWRLLAASEGRPMCLLVEWDGFTAVPLTLFDGPACLPLTGGAPV